ncbi:MAG: hypothetical protein M3Y59_16510 [Myxococcota bacterium]|nr:hypothetical protein [Myxococcota bacterium]
MLLVVVIVVLTAGATPGSCSGDLPPTPEVAFTVLEVNGEVVGVPTEVLTRTEARALLPNREDLEGVERAIRIDEVAIRFKAELSPRFHAWLSEGFSSDARADLALVFVSADHLEVGRITLAGSRLESLSRGTPGGDDDGTFTVRAQDHNSSRSNKTASVAFNLPDGGSGDELDPRPVVEISGMPPDLLAAVTVDAYSLRRCGNGTVCGSTTHFLVPVEQTKELERWFGEQAAAGLSPVLTLTYRTLQGQQASRLSVSLSPHSWRASAGGENPLFEASSIEGVNPIYE